MTSCTVDCFALLGLARLPWIDPETVKERFVALSSQCHPDKLGEASGEERASAAGRFADLNAAQQTLRDNKSRIAHLLELETGLAPGKVEQVPPAAADLFFQVGALCRQVDAFLATRARAASPLIKATLFARGLEWSARVQDLQAVITRLQEGLERELRAMNSAWVGPGPEADPALVGGGRGEFIRRLEAIYRESSFLARWSGQLQERLVQLAA